MENERWLWDMIRIGCEEYYEENMESFNPDEHGTESGEAQER